MTETVDPRQFYLRLADIEVQLEGNALRERSLELQRYLVCLAFFALLTSLGVYAVKEINVGPAVLFSQKAAWISLFELVALGYLILAYGFSAWIDSHVYRSKMSQIAGQTLPLQKQAFEEQRVAAEIGERMSVISDELRTILGNHEEAERIAALSDEHWQLARRSLETYAGAEEKLLALLKLLKRTKYMRWFAFALDLFFPISLAIMAGACVWVSTVWKW